MVLEIIALICIMLLVIFLLPAIADTVISNSAEYYNGPRIVIMSFFLSLISCILLCIHLTQPTAMDVYRGEPTKDKVSVDSTVVWNYNK